MNAENIRPYAVLAHEAAQKGGPNLFIREHALVNQQIGIALEKATEGKKAAILLLMSITIWEGGKWVYRKIRESHAEKLHNLTVESQSIANQYSESNGPIPDNALQEE